MGGAGDHHLHCCYREQLSYAIYAKFREPKLFQMAVKGDWDEIPARCRTHPKEATFVHKYAPNDTALHRLLRPLFSCEEQQQEIMDAETVYQMNRLQLAAVEALLEANRQAAVWQDSFGRTPLHLACMDVHAAHEDEEAAAVATLLLDRHPAAAHTVDAEGRTPLHYLVARASPAIPAPLVAKLLDKMHPDAVLRPDAVGETVWDVVRQRENEISNAAEIVKLLERVSDGRRRSSSSSSAVVRTRSITG